MMLDFSHPMLRAALPMVFVTTLLLLIMVLGLSLTAIIMRNKMRKKYVMGTF